MATHPFVRQVADHVEELGLFPPDALVVVAVSGGADSMALLHALVALQQECDYPLRLHIAHLNHRLRGEASDAEAAFVEAAADGMGLPRTIEGRDVAGMAEREKGSLEEIARNERYAFLEKVCLQEGAKTVAVGHHAEDNVETILHRIVRGTGLRGIAGIAPQRPIQRGGDIRVVRPLLSRTKQDILRFLTERGEAYCEDASNASMDSTRNRIRHALLPLLEQDFNPQCRDALLRLAEQARWAADFIRETVQKTFETLVISRTDQELVLNAHALARRDRIIQTELVRAGIASFEIGEQELTFKHLKTVTDLIADPVSGKQLTLPGGMTARVVYNRLILSLPTDEPRERIADRVAVHVPGRTVLPVRRMEIDTELFWVTAEQVATRMHNRDRFEEWMDLDNVHLPLVVRGREPGGRFWPLGAPGTKKLADFLSDTKVAPGDREKVAVLCDQLGPIWMIGYRIDERVKLSRITRQVLRVRARMLDD